MTRFSGEDNIRNMRAAAEAIAERQPGLTKPSLKRYSWSRLHSDLLDDNRWALVAKRTGAPLPIVEALVMRLEAHANNAQPRGDVLEFNAEAMAARWGVDAEMIARIYDEFERPDIGWISQSQITSFWQRNPDSDQDATGAARQRRKRERDRATKAAILAGTGGATGAKRSRPLTPAERKRLQRQRERLQRQSGVTKSHEIAVTGHASRDAVVTGKASQNEALSTSHRDSVTSRPEQSRIQDSEIVTGAPSPASLGRIEFADKAKALQWLRGEGEAILMRRCQVMRSKAGRMIQRWCVTLAQDVTAMAEIILETSVTCAQGAAFERMVVEQVARKAADMLGPALPFPLRDVKGI